MNKEWRVVKIPNDTTIVINGGKGDGLNIGTELVIFQEGPPVIDPVTKESLGTLDYVKATVEVTTLYAKMSACKRIIEKSRQIGVAQLVRTYKQVSRLNVNAEDISGGYSDDYDNLIRVGDRVRLQL